MIKKYNQKIILGLFLFGVFLLWNLILFPITLDEIWNYGFSHSLYSGLVPYKDFNMVITPFYPFLMSIGLLFLFYLYQLPCHFLVIIYFCIICWCYCYT